MFFAIVVITLLSLGVAIAWSLLLVLCVGKYVILVFLVSFFLTFLALSLCYVAVDLETERLW